MLGKLNKWQQLLLLVCWVSILGFCFAEVEIQIEGPHGWASSLPTWKIDDGWFVNIFWGGRPLTGYHAWIFSFIFLVFHTPFFIIGKWNWKLECRTLACIEIFWLVEDFLWFVLNPAYGISKFTSEYVLWHQRWLLFMPWDYWIFLVLATGLLYVSYYGWPGPKAPAREKMELH